VGNNGEELENKIRGFYLPKDYIRMGILRDGKKLFTVVFSWSKMMLSWSKRMVSWRKVHWVFFLERRTKFEWEKKNSMDFPEGHHPFAEGQHHFAEGENKWKKFFAIPKFIILLLPSQAFFLLGSILNLPGLKFYLLYCEQGKTRPHDRTASELGKQGIFFPSRHTLEKKFLVFLAR